MSDLFIMLDNWGGMHAGVMSCAAVIHPCASFGRACHLPFFSKWGTLCTENSIIINSPSLLPFLGRKAGSLHDASKRADREGAIAVLRHDHNTATLRVTPFAMASSLRDEDEAVSVENMLDLPRVESRISAGHAACT